MPRVVKKASKVKPVEEEPIRGWWVDRNGKTIPIYYSQTHGGVARKLWGWSAIEALHKGFLRLKAALGTMYYEVAGEMTPQQSHVMKDLAAEYDCPRFERDAEFLGWRDSMGTGLASRFRESVRATIERDEALIQRLDL